MVKSFPLNEQNLLNTLKRLKESTKNDQFKLSDLKGKSKESINVEFDISDPVGNVKNLLDVLKYYGVVSYFETGTSLIFDLPSGSRYGDCLFLTMVK